MPPDGWTSRSQKLQHCRHSCSWAGTVGVATRLSVGQVVSLAERECIALDTGFRAQFQLVITRTRELNEGVELLPADCEMTVGAPVEDHVECACAIRRAEHQEDALRV